MRRLVNLAIMTVSCEWIRFESWFHSPVPKVCNKFVKHDLHETFLRQKWLASSCDRGNFAKKRTLAVTPGLFSGMLLCVELMPLLILSNTRRAWIFSNHNECTVASAGSRLINQLIRCVKALYQRQGGGLHTPYAVDALPAENGGKRR